MWYHFCSSTASEDLALLKYRNLLILLQQCGAEGTNLSNISHWSRSSENEMLQVSFFCFSCCNYWLSCVQMLADRVMRPNIRLTADAVREGRFITLLLDETTDVSNVSHIVFYIRLVHRGQTHTYFGAVQELGSKKDMKSIKLELEKYIACKLLCCQVVSYNVVL